jgi:hypothetical protein
VKQSRLEPWGCGRTGRYCQDQPLLAFAPLYRLIQNPGKAAVARRSLILRPHLS